MWQIGEREKELEGELEGKIVQEEEWKSGAVREKGVWGTRLWPRSWKVCDGVRDWKEEERRGKLEEEIEALNHDHLE